jgi:hypothetical protein
MGAFASYKDAISFTQFHRDLSNDFVSVSDPFAIKVQKFSPPEDVWGWYVVYYDDEGHMENECVILSENEIPKTSTVPNEYKACFKITYRPNDKQGMEDEMILKGRDSIKNKRRQYETSSKRNPDRFRRQR